MFDQVITPCPVCHLLDTVRQTKIVAPTEQGGKARGWTYGCLHCGAGFGVTAQGGFRIGDMRDRPIPQSTSTRDAKVTDEMLKRLSEPDMRMPSA